MKKIKYLILSMLSFLCLPVYANPLCSEDGVKRTMALVGSIINIVKIAVPALLMVVAFVILAKGLLSGNDSTKETWEQLGKKAILAIAIFFIPDIVYLGLNLVTGYSKTESDFKQCTTCLKHPEQCV